MLCSLLVELFGKDWKLCQLGWVLKFKRPHSQLGSFCLMFVEQDPSSQLPSSTMLAALLPSSLSLWSWIHPLKL